MFVSFYRIDLREVPDEYRQSESCLVQVLPNSPMLLKKEVERFAYYFKRELHYDFPQFEAADNGEYTAYLFANEANRYPRVWAGACCFRTRAYTDVGLNSPIQALQWMWIHPYCRARGILKECWPTLRKNHGDFFQELPISPAMLGFLLKHNRDSAFLPIYKRNTSLSDSDIEAMFAASVSKGKKNAVKRTAKKKFSA
jgi:hypothetical protein